jgi:Fe-S cluster assembly protein SufD
MIHAAEKVEKIASSRQEWLAKNGNSAEPWLQHIRDRSFSQFCALGVPTRRMEGFKYAKIPAIESLLPKSAESLLAAVASPDAVALEATNPEADIHLKMAGSTLVGDRKLIATLEKQGILYQLGNLRDTQDSETWNQTLARFAREDSSNPLFYLNGSYVTHGILLKIPSSWGNRRIVIEHLATTAGDEQSNTGSVAHSPSDGIFPRIFLDVASGANVTIIERFDGPVARQNDSSGQIASPDISGLLVSVTDVSIGNDARVNYHVITGNCTDSLFAMDHHFRLAAKTNLQLHTCHMNSRNLRHDLVVNLAGEEAEATVNGIYLAGSQQVIDNNTLIRHVAPRTKSEQFYKGIVGRTGRGAFTGRIEVLQEAVGCQAFQLNKNLLLDDEAEADVRPQLAISTDDIKCTHGATIGQLDATEVFYLQTRGIDEATARAMLSQAFADEILMKFPDAATGKALRETSRKFLQALIAGGTAGISAPSATDLAPITTATEERE